VAAELLAPFMSEEPDMYSEESDVCLEEVGVYSSPQTVLIVDDDLGFVFWLGRALDESGCAAFPARSIPDAGALLRELKVSLDLLIVNPTLPGTAGFIEGLRRSGAQFKVIAVTEDVEQPWDSPLGAIATRPKPRGRDDISKWEWLHLILSVLTREAGFAGD